MDLLLNQSISKDYSVGTDLKLASLCIHGEFVKIHGTHESNSCCRDIKDLTFFRHPQPLKWDSSDLKTFIFL